MATGKIDIMKLAAATDGNVREMRHAGFTASLMRAQRLRGDRVHSLPSGSQIPVFPLAALPGAPESWVREAGSYVCPVDTGWGLWFSWTGNDHLNTAVIPSVKGMNPITGQKLGSFDGTSTYGGEWGRHEEHGLEAYSSRCPVHDVPFAHGRLCEKCGYEWPPQNYVCDPNTLWWDGFRYPDGTVRQFFFSDEDVRDVASAVIGKENTVPAFGFAFWRPKEPRTPPHSMTRGLSLGACGQSVGVMYGSAGVFGPTGPTGVFGPTGPTGPFGDEGFTGEVVDSFCADVSSDEIRISASLDDAGMSNGSLMKSSPARGARLCAKGDSTGFDMQTVKRYAKSAQKRSKSVSVDAGAKIRQELKPCLLGLEGWKDKPDGIIRLYFVFEEQFREILKGGVKELASSPDGYMKNVPVG